MEAIIFFLVIVWMIRLQMAGSSEQGAGSSRPFARKLSFPLSLFFAFVLFQLLPLPPGLIRLLSPATFEVYTHSLPGWAGERGAGSSGQGATQSAKSKAQSDQTANPQSPKSAIRNPQSEVSSAPVLLPTPAEVKSGVPVPFEQGAESREQGAEVRGQRSEGRDQSDSDSRLPTSDFRPLFVGKWLPLSLAPSQTRSDLLKLASYAALFFLVLLYPFQEGREQGAGSGGQGAQGKVRGRLISLVLKRRKNAGSSRQRSAFSGQFSNVRGQSSASSSNPKSAIRNPQSENGPLSLVTRRLLILVTLSGLIVAAIGFIQRFTWNGRILWFFMPYDWGGFAPQISELRASGPFVDPDHFANYLAMILPLALGFVIYSRYLFRKDSQIASRIFFGLTVLVAFTAVLLSLSRSGWMTAVLGTGLLLWFGPADYARQQKGSAKSAVAVRGSVAIIALLLIVSLFFVGSGARQQVDSRLQETVTADMGFTGRAFVWRDSLHMARDFPLFGVGLGSWQDLFQRYQDLPWTPTFYREAHNDYVELLGETGVVGFALLFLFFFMAGKLLFSGLRLSSGNAGSKVVVAMLLAALATMTLHEFFDFNLQIPANALLFTVLLAVGVRLTAGSREQGAEVGGQTSEVSNRRSAVSGPWSVVHHFAPYGAILLAVFLIAMALRQEMVPYPYNLKMPATVAEAKDMILAHPALSTPHLYLLRLSLEKAPVEWQINQLRAALWLNPNDPYVRDQYARLLLSGGKQAEGLAEISRSVSNAPLFAVHYYLNSRLLPWLSPQEKSAIESGFKRANALGYPDATESLAAFYAGTGRFVDQGKLFEEAADRTREPSVSADLLVKAAAAYLKAAEDKKGETLLRKAAAREPTDPRPYQMLATIVYGRQKDIANITGTISEGVKNGAPAFDLYLALAEGAQKAGAHDETKKALTQAKEALQTGSEDGQQPLRRYYLLAETAQRLGFRDEATAALLQALKFRPSSTETLLRLANLYLQDGKFGRAAYYFRSYVEINPAAADAFYHLAVAEERQYRFAAAEAAYKRAVELAPEVQGYRQGYEALKRKVADNRKSEG